MKKTYLLDTNIVSEFSKDKPNEQVLEFYRARNDLCAISAITWQELTRGVSRMPEGRKKQYLKKCLSNYEEDFEVISFDKFSAQICGEIQAAAEKNGKPVPYYDSRHLFRQVLRPNLWRNPGRSRKKRKTCSLL